LPPEARIYYRYHPYFDHTFKTLQRSGGKSGRITLELSVGKTLSVPDWMLKPESAELQLGVDVALPRDTLLDVIALLTTNCFSLEPVIDALESSNGSAKL
jgi:hypothetical protein